MFFTINVTGLLEVYDVLARADSPVTAFRVCNECLTAVAPHGDGQFLAVGSHDGNIYLVECSEGHTVNTRADKASFTAVSAFGSARNCSKRPTSRDITPWKVHGSNLTWNICVCVSACMCVRARMCVSCFALCKKIRLQRFPPTYVLLRELGSSGLLRFYEFKRIFQL